jgi:hypothetical protein
MKRLTKIIMIALAVTPTVCLAGEYTIIQPITQIDFDADADSLWILGGAKWGAPSCPNATWVLVDVSTHRKQMLAITMAAHAAGKTVRFWGNCISPERLVATYVTVHE